MKRIRLTQGKFAVVDDEDFEWVSRHKWMCHVESNGRRTAVREVEKKGKRRSVYLHREMIKAEPGIRIWVINGNWLDCRRRNLQRNRGGYVKNGIGYLFLTKGEIAVVSIDDYGHLKGRNWSCGENWQGRKEAQRGEAGKHIRMSREIMKVGKGEEIDHINGDTLDNRRCNLRVCSHRQNAMNKRVVRSSSGFKGVFRRGNGKYRAAIRVRGKLIVMGQFDGVEQAAHVYDEAARKYFGEFACTNEDLGLLKGSSRKSAKRGK